MLKHIFNWAILTMAVVISAYVLEGVEVDSIFVAFVVAVVLAIINTLLKPILVILTLPVNVMTFGLFTLVINAFLVMLVVKIVPGFEVINFWWAMLFSVVLTIVNFGLSLIKKD